MGQRFGDRCVDGPFLGRPVAGERFPARPRGQGKRHARGDQFGRQGFELVQQPFVFPFQPAEAVRRALSDDQAGRVVAQRTRARA